MNAFLLAMSLSTVAAQPAESAGSKPALTMPAQIQAMPGKAFTVKAETNLKWMRWSIPPGLERVPPAETAYGERAFVGYGPAGVYEFKVEGTLQDQYVEAKCVVFVGQPVPPPPGPGPAPVPPPVPPQPADPLFTDLQRLYAADAAAQKVTAKAELAGVYRYGADLVAGRKKAKVATVAELFEGLRKASEFAMPEAAPLTTVRQRLTDEHARQFPSAPTAPLTDDLRKQAEGYFLRVAQFLDAVK